MLNECIPQVDLEADFDPEEHDKKMAQLYNDDYYGEVCHLAPSVCPFADAVRYCLHAQDRYA
jgi:hypothetical protein